MTLVIAAHGTNFVILGADSRGTIGTEAGGLIIGLEDRSKLIKITPHVGLMLFEQGDYGMMLVNEFQASCGKIDGITEVADKFRAHCREKWNEWLKGVRPEAFPRFGFLISGLDPDPNQQGNFVIPRTRSLLSAYGFVPSYHRKFAPMGISSLAYYLLKKKYKKDMTIESLSSLVAYTIHETAWVDRRVGGRIHITLIDKSGYRPYRSQEIKRWIEDYESSH